MTEEKLRRLLKGMLFEGERTGHVHKLGKWPSAPPEQDAVRNMWRRKGFVIIEPFDKSFWEETERWAVQLDFWDKMKLLGDHLSFAPTGLMCGASRWSTGQA